ncbi:MAG TPA: nicotinate-nucleotide--dimethylbenzimidazole phosphoribosyltransferase [Polyangia bacterium]|nr:nicotinate-nucleotide--dimethylbenzimidazole phosphoribosyltransferase [Polyangia bacterium]
MTTEASLDIGALAARIIATDDGAAAEAQRLLDRKTKPPRSLGRLEDLVCQLAAIRGVGAPQTRLPGKAIVVMGADHGVAAEGVSAYPQEVTGQMLLNFARGGAAINVLARQAGARIVVVDIGVAHPPEARPEIRARRIGAGTANFTRGPAMTRAQALQALATGADLAGALARDGVGLIGIGDMGIGNTTASSALAAVFTGAPAEETTGRGTGIDDATFRRKVDVVRRGLEVNRPDATDGVDALAKVGGFEIAGLAGVVLGAAAARLPVVVDGFIAGAAALAAVRIAPNAAGYLIASHRSVEAGHRLVLQALGKKPLLDLDLRLGEGTGAALAMMLIDAALAIAAEMATFESAGVSGATKP